MGEHGSGMGMGWMEATVHNQCQSRSIRGFAWSRARVDTSLLRYLNGLRMGEKLRLGIPPLIIYQSVNLIQ